MVFSTRGTAIFRDEGFRRASRDADVCRVRYARSTCRVLFVTRELLFAFSKSRRVQRHYPVPTERSSQRASGIVHGANLKSSKRTNSATTTWQVTLSRRSILLRVITTALRPSFGFASEGGQVPAMRARANDASFTWRTVLRRAWCSSVRRRMA